MIKIDCLSNCECNQSQVIIRSSETLVVSAEQGASYSEIVVFSSKTLANNTRLTQLAFACSDSATVRGFSP
jgi:hypothetical protein